MTGLRRGYDGIIPSELPPGGDIYLAYVDGEWPNYDQLADLFPDAAHVPISNHYGLAALVLDFGEGAATNIHQLIAWVAAKRGMGAQPWVYCTITQWVNLVKPAFTAAELRPPWWWEAFWDGTTEIFADPFTVGHQFAGAAGYDESIFLPRIPGFDPDPAPPPPAAAPEAPMMIIRNNTQGSDAVFGAEVLVGLPGGPVHLTSSASVTAIVAALRTGNLANVDQPDYDAIIAAATPKGT